MMNRRTAIGLASATALLGTGQAVAATSETSSVDLENITGNVAWNDVPKNTSFDAEMRALIETTAIAANGGKAAARFSLAHSLDAGIATEKLLEAIMQAAPYAGAAAAMETESEFLNLLAQRKIPAPSSASTVTAQTRFEKGLKEQTAIFGEAISKMHSNATDENRFMMVDMLSAHCFGDFYTRKHLELKQRELLTFVAVASLGGCDPQARAHVAGCLNVGWSKKQLIDAAVIACTWIGFPRTLNAISAINAVAK